jgi:large subunit ribosomal protein L5
MRLIELYKKEIRNKLKENFGFKNIFSIPKLLKVSVNVGVGRLSKDKAHIENVVKTLTRITGQKPILVKAKKSISAFKVRQGDIVGISVTIRGARMYDFIEKMISITFPRVRDFRGLNPKNIDKQGNLSIGFKEHLAFPEIKADEVDNIHGLEVNIATSAKNYQEGLALFNLLGFPFKKEN